MAWGWPTLHNAGVPSDRILYRIVWMAAVALPLLAAALAVIFISDVGLAITAAVLGLSLSASALAAHLRLRIQLAGIRKGPQGGLVASPAAPVVVPPPSGGLTADDLETRLALVEGRIIAQVGDLAREHRPAPVSTGLHERLGRRSVAVVASEALIAELPADVEVQRLYPGQVAEALKASGADTIIIEENALAEGPWRATLNPQGAPLLAELHRAMSGADGTRRHSYVVAQPGRPGLAARGLRSGAIVIDDSLERPSGASASLLDSLITHRATHG